MSTFQIMIFVLICGVINSVTGHGKLIDPPGRSTMWRYNFSTPVNYDDNQLFCGGYQVQWHRNGGKCGVCGDPYDGERLNEPPGKYATGIISRRFKQGEIMNVKVDISASHRGYFEFRICPNNNVSAPVSQDCLDQNILQEVSTGGTKYYLGEQGVGEYTAQIKLPKSMSCTQCVLQWRYRTGNRWGCYNNDFTKGPCGLGYGPQEEFYACADIEITPNNAETTTNTPVVTTATVSPTQQITSTTSISTTKTSKQPSTTTTSTISTTTTTTTTATQQTSTTQTVSSTPSTTTVESTSTTTDLSSSTSTSPITTTPAMTTTSLRTTSSFDPSIGTRTICVAGGPWKGQVDVDMWCVVNCERNFCPSSHCSCSTLNSLTGMIISQDNVGSECKSTVDLPENHDWCRHNCPEGLCPPNWCICEPDNSG